MINNGFNKSDILKIYPEAKYFIYGNGIYDLSRSIHPIGKCKEMSFDKLLGIEIDRYFYGGFFMEFIDNLPESHHTNQSCKQWFVNN